MVSDPQGLKDAWCTIDVQQISVEWIRVVEENNSKNIAWLWAEFYQKDTEMLSLV